MFDVSLVVKAKYYSQNMSCIMLQICITLVQHNNKDLNKQQFLFTY